MSLRDKLISYISSNFAVPKEDVNDDLPLFSSQLLDSFSMIDLVTFVETEGKVKFGVLDVTLDNLDSIGRILAYVDRRGGGKR